MVVIATAASSYWFSYWFSFYYSGHCDPTPACLCSLATFQIYEGYGQTECTAGCTFTMPGDATSGTDPLILIDLVGLGSISILWNETRYLIYDVLSGIIKAALSTLPCGSFIRCIIRKRVSWLHVVIEICSLLYRGRRSWPDRPALGPRYQRSSSDCCLLLLHA